MTFPTDGISKISQERELPDPEISVIIATRNRGEHLRSVSLASLARQMDAPSFEVVVWDASDDDASQHVTEAFAAAHPGIDARYFRAARVGLARQRNDAVGEARGRIIFFIDDDSAVSPGGLRSLASMFNTDASLSGGCLPLLYGFPEGTLPANLRAKGAVAAMLKGYYALFEPAKKASGYFPPVAPTPSEPAGYLFGCDMAFRREIFARHTFDERLHRFSNFAICDDLIFSRVLLQEGHKLCVAPNGSVTHVAASGGRMQYGFSKGRVEGYSAGLVWIVAALPWSRWSVLPFALARVGVFSAILLNCLQRPWQAHRWGRAAGYLSGLATVLREELPR